MAQRSTVRFNLSRACVKLFGYATNRHSTASCPFRDRRPCAGYRRRPCRVPRTCAAKVWRPAALPSLVPAARRCGTSDQPDRPGGTHHADPLPDHARRQPAQAGVARRDADPLACVEAAGRGARRAKADATLMALKEQEAAGIDIVTDGEQSRQHFVHGFLEHVDGVDFGRKVKMGIRNNRYDAMVPTVTAELRLRGRVHATEARLAALHTDNKIKIHHARADDDRRYAGRRALRRPRQDGVRVRAPAQRGGARAPGRRRRRHPIRRACLQRLHGGARMGHRGAARARGPDLHDRGAHLLRLRHRAEHPLEARPRRGMAQYQECFRHSRKAGSTRCRWNAPTRACR